MSTVTDTRLIGELLRNPNAARVRIVEQGFAAAGHPAIRPPHFPILEYIDREHGSRVSYLAQHAHVTAQAMGELVTTWPRMAMWNACPIRPMAAHAWFG